MNFNEVGNNGLVEGYAVIKQCDKKTAKNGNFYLDIVLSETPQASANSALERSKCSLTNLVLSCFLYRVSAFFFLIS